MVNRRLLRCRCDRHVRPCGPLCGQTVAREGNDSGPNYLERFWGISEGFRCAERWAGENPWRFNCAKSHHSSPQCGLLRRFAGFEN